MASAHAQRLEGLLRAGVRSADPEIKLALNQLGRELKHRLSGGSSNSLEIFTTAHAAIAKLRGPAYLDLRFDCAYNCAQYFYIGGYVDAALSAAVHLKALANQTNNRDLKRKAHGFAGVVFSDVGDVGQSLAEHASALDLARDMEDETAECRSLQNIAVTLLDAGFFSESISFSEQVAARSGNCSDTKILISTAKANCALARLHLGECEQGLKDVQDAIKLSPEPIDGISALKRTIREFVYVLIALELGNISLARARSSECTKHSMFGDLPRSRLLARVAEGLCEVYGGRVDKGLNLLECTATTAWGDVGVWARTETLGALAKAYDAVGQTDRALLCLRDLLSFLQESREKSIRAILTVSTESGTLLFSEPEKNLLSLQAREARLRTRLAQQEAQSACLELFERLAAAADLKEEASGEHGFRVGRLSFLLSQQRGIEVGVCGAVELAARVHDLGKIAIPDRILQSSTQLREAERKFMCSHTSIGAELLAKSNIPQLRMAEEIARHHHEWWNGEGYPSKMKGKRIPIHARIVAIADVFDALTHGRPFSPAWPIDRALEEIKARKGTQFDPELTDLFLDLIAKLRAEHEDLDEYLGRAGRNSPFLQARNKIRQMLAEEREHEKMATVEGNETRH
jgi:putative two-component system response regulator